MMQPSALPPRWRPSSSRSRSGSALNRRPRRASFFFGYSTNYLIDVENAIIVDVEATAAIRQAEVVAAKQTIERSMERFDLYAAKDSWAVLGSLVYERSIEAHVSYSTNRHARTALFPR